MTIKAENEYTKTVQDAVLATRVTNALLLAHSLGLDMTEPVQAQKVLRGLSSVERYVKGDSHD